MDSATQQARKGQTAAAIGDVADIDLCARLQELAFDMGKRSDPGRANFSVPGWDFARPINSATDLAGTDGCTARTSECRNASDRRE